jgi:hypothetical protein
VHRYEKLEKLYYKRKILKFLIIFLIFILIVGLIFLIMRSQHEEKKNDIKKVEKNITKKTFKSVIKINNSKIDLNKTKKISKKEKIKIKNNNEFLAINFKVPVIDLNLSKKELNKTRNITKKAVIKKITTPKHKKNKNPVIIEESVNINDLIKNFNNNPSFELAIQISEYYLNHNKLDMAKLWALRANSINPDRFESWKIFAIILIKRNEKAKAKEVLQTYLNDYGQNEEIQKLLRSIDE